MFSREIITSALGVTIRKINMEKITQLLKVSPANIGPLVIISSDCSNTIRKNCMESIKTVLKRSRCSVSPLTSGPVQIILPQLFFTFYFSIFENLYLLLPTFRGWISIFTRGENKKGQTCATSGMNGEQYRRPRPPASPAADRLPIRCCSHMAHRRWGSCGSVKESNCWFISEH